MEPLCSAYLSLTRAMRHNGVPDKIIMAGSEATGCSGIVVGTRRKELLLPERQVRHHFGPYTLARQ